MVFFFICPLCNCLFWCLVRLGGAWVRAVHTCSYWYVCVWQWDLRRSCAMRCLTSMRGKDSHGCDASQWVGGWNWSMMLWWWKKVLKHNIMLLSFPGWLCSGFLHEEACWRLCVHWVLVCKVLPPVSLVVLGRQFTATITLKLTDVISSNFHPHCTCIILKQTFLFLTYLSLETAPHNSTDFNMCFNMQPSSFWWQRVNVCFFLIT